MKVRIPKRGIWKQIPIRLNECLTLKGLDEYTKSHCLVGMKVVFPKAESVQITHLSKAMVDMNDVVGVINSFAIRPAAGWIDVEFFQTEMVKEFLSENPRLIAVPRIFGEPTGDGKFKIKRLITFVIYPDRSTRI